ncbi:GNAT family N-acetyltransferase [Micromonospora inositola]|uniref:GNAT family N-acetyltransferase n=1 Tax=Micromonospora inositola TaxID=47865 RepID=UPI000B5AC79D|nr:GNAT family protein [Micromonospora inositola]
MGDPGVPLGGRVGRGRSGSRRRRPGTAPACATKPGAESRGLATLAARRIIDWAIRERGIHRVEWHTNVANAPSIAVARRLGMRHDGTLRQVLPGPDGRIDLEVWSVLAPEWTA